MRTGALGERGSHLSREEIRDLEPRRVELRLRRLELAAELQDRLGHVEGAARQVRGDAREASCRCHARR